jgi:hypothetical protein
MYLNALEFLEDERETWAPFEALAGLADDLLTEPVAGAHGWSGRDLMAHLLAWQSSALDTARELAIGETSPTKVRLDADWELRGGDVINAELAEQWRAVPLAELRERFLALPGELRGTLTVVPETRWLKHADHLQYFLDETTDHYQEHRADLAAVLAAAGR